MKTHSVFFVMLAFWGMNEAMGQWLTSGSNIYNSNTGNVGIGNSSPTTLLHVAKNMTEPTITVRNLGGIGGATYTMTDDVSGANWKFKATNTGGFKIRDHANSLDVFLIEPNSSASSIYIKSGGNVGIGTTNPAASARLEIAGTDKGFLPPRLTTDQINAISGPAIGLMVYNTTLNKPQYFDGTGWRNFDGSHFLGESFGGGLVFYLTDGGQHGLISAPVDQSTASAWGCAGTDVNVTSTVIGSGQANTTAILNACTDPGIAARLCNDLVLNGYNDWFLPSLEELNEMYVQKTTIGAGDNIYWSSSESWFLAAWVVHFGNGMIGDQDKAMGCSVRAIRAF